MLHANFLQRNLLATNAVAPCGLHSTPDCRSSFAFTFIHRYILLLISFDFRLPIKLQSFPEHVVKAIWTGKKKKKKNMEMKMTVPVQLWRYFSVKCEYGKIHKFVYFLSFFFLSFFFKNCEFRHLTSFQDRLACLASLLYVYIHSRDCIYNIKTEMVEKGVKCWLVSAVLVAATINPSICVCVCVCVCRASLSHKSIPNPKGSRL